MARALSEDAVRAHVLSLYNGCDNDLGVVLERLTRVLQDVGRPDIALESDAHGALHTVSQDTAHATRLRRRFLDRVEAATDPTRPHGSDPRAALRKADAALAAVLEPRLPAPAGPVPATHGAPHAVPYPTSRYSGNYLLQRYGGDYPAECRSSPRHGRGLPLFVPRE